VPREETLNIVKPEEFSVDEPIEAAPSKKVTLPVGVPPPRAATFAVKVMAFPKVDGLRDEARVVVVVVSAPELVGMTEIPYVEVAATGIAAMEACVLTSNTCTFPLGPGPPP
jgi:hypothetical protein